MNNVLARFKAFAERGNNGAFIRSEEILELIRQAGEDALWSHAAAVEATVRYCGPGVARVVDELRKHALDDGYGMGEYAAQMLSALDWQNRWLLKRVDDLKAKLSAAEAVATGGIETVMRKETRS